MRNLLDIKLLGQTFKGNASENLQIEQAKAIAEMYSKLENGISVLSDLKSRKSYIFYNSIANNLGLSEQKDEINSIWEDELLSKVHPEDLTKKYQLEFQFFRMIQSVSLDERQHYEVITRLRVKNREGKYLMLKHRLIYIANAADGNVWLALCLYNLIYDHPEFSIPSGLILNKQTGKVIDNEIRNLSNLLSSREQEILKLIKHGKRSKEIADKLSLSINTINRHRQNIFQKLNVTNALEACRVAETLELF